MHKGKSFSSCQLFRIRSCRLSLDLLTGEIENFVFLRIFSAHRLEFKKDSERDRDMEIFVYIPGFNCYFKKYLYLYLQFQNPVSLKFYLFINIFFNLPFFVFETAPRNICLPGRKKKLFVIFFSSNRVYKQNLQHCLI